MTSSLSLLGGPANPFTPLAAHSRSHWLKFLCQALTAPLALAKAYSISFSDNGFLMGILCFSLYSLTAWAKTSLTDLVTELDLLDCEAEVQVNWTASTSSHGLPRDLHGDIYIIEFTQERPYIAWEGTRVTGRYFPSDIRVLNEEDSPLDVLEVPSTSGFILTSVQVWTDRGLGTEITIRPLT